MSTTAPLETSNPDIDPAGFDLVTLLLAEQQSLTAVERFSAFHEQHEDDEPAQARYYKSLLPATPPKPGQQLAFNVDLDACSGCKACVVACHTLNGLDEDESWRRVGTLTIGGDQPRIQHVTTACHHCEDPGCLNGCPVKAYDKDPATGIVRHLDDQCIGCKYCTMMCPYEVPRYSKRLGIVRKCDMCHQRLKVGEAPACVQSCPNEAISIEVVPAGGQAFSDDECLAAGAPSSSITRPSTRYESNLQHELGDALPHDHGVDEVAESHWPLAAMLVATQASVGMLLAERLAAAGLVVFGSRMPIEATQLTALLALIVAGVGMNLAPLHLGQPLRAWRVFLGLRTSWLSREAVVLGKYVGALAAAVGLLWLPVFADYVPESISQLIPSWAAKATLGIALLCGLAGLFSSAMIYIVTKRQLWRFGRTTMRFFGTAAVAGTAFAAAAMNYGQAPWAITFAVIVTSLGLAAAKLWWEWRTHLGPARDSDDDYETRSRLLTLQKLDKTRQLRVSIGIAAVTLLGLASLASLSMSPTTGAIVVTLYAITLLAAEYLERLLYFSSVVYDRMPGTLR